MRVEHLDLLACPRCQSELELQASNQKSDSVETGTLSCSSCRSRYDIVRSVPRFVPKQNYADGFGFQWTKHATTEFDSYSGAKISESRFFNETRWPRDMRGQVILEVGCGSGRFSEQAQKTGATVVSFDYS